METWMTPSRELHEQLKAMDDMNYPRSWAQCYELLKVVDDMNNSGSRELRPLNAMNNSGLWIIWMILGFEDKTLNVMNNIGL